MLLLKKLFENFALLELLVNVIMEKHFGIS